MNKKFDDKNGKFIFCTHSKSGYENYPNPHDSVYCSTQITLTDAISLPSQAPPCERVISYTHTLKIRHTKMIDSIEIIDGKPEKGKKISVTGIAHIKIEYVSCHDSSQKAFYYDWEQPFNAVILKSACEQQQLFPLNFNLKDYMVYAYMEFFQVSCKTEYLFNTILALRIWLQEINPDHSSKDRECSREIKEDITDEWN